MSSITSSSTDRKPRTPLTKDGKKTIKAETAATVVRPRPSTSVRNGASAMTGITRRTSAMGSTTRDALTDEATITAPMTPAAFPTRNPPNAPAAVVRSASVSSE